MVTTIKNIQENSKICVIGGYFKIIGIAKVFNSGKNFNECVKIVASQDKSLKVKHAILIEVKTVFDLEKVKKIA